jgi:hypothetical protein
MSRHHSLSTQGPECEGTFGDPACHIIVEWHTKKRECNETLIAKELTNQKTTKTDSFGSFRFIPKILLAALNMASIRKKNTKQGV